MSDAGVPIQIAEQYQQIAARAGAVGRPLRPIPVLEISTRGRQHSRVILGPPGAESCPRVVLSVDTLTTASPERAFTIAHELAHVLHRQERVLEVTTTILAGAAVAGAGSVSAVLAAAHSALVGSGAYSTMLLTGAMAAAVGVWLMLVTLVRREEAAADAIAATMFGEALTPAGVHRLHRNEGAAARFVPTLLRSHPHPESEARRRNGLLAAGRPGSSRPVNS